MAKIVGIPIIQFFFNRVAAQNNLHRKDTFLLLWGNYNCWSCSRASLTQLLFIFWCSLEMHFSFKKIVVNVIKELLNNSMHFIFH